MKKVGHIFASEAKKNSGDFTIGFATKKRFEEIIGEKCQFENLNSRNPNLFVNIDEINKKYDYLIVGAGGLILPDTEPNLNSGWQWNITVDSLQKIKIPIYVISIGYNLFFNQEIDMPRRNDNHRDPKRNEIFKKHMRILVEKAKYFTMRHKNDMVELIKIIGPDYKNKIHFEFCPTIKYTEDKNLTSSGDYIAFEIKDDRLWRRTYKIGIGKFYEELEKTIKYLIKENHKVAFLSHDGSKMFYNHLKSKGVNIPLIDNSVSNENEIYKNYQKIKILIATAGHSQMIGSAIKNLKVISLVTHPKILNYCLDKNNSDYIEPNKDFNFSEKLINLIKN